MKCIQWIYLDQKIYILVVMGTIAHTYTRICYVLFWLAELWLLWLVSVWQPVLSRPASHGLFFFQTFPPGGSVWPATLICPSAATESLIHPERGIELLRDEDMTSWAHLMSMIGQLTCRSGILPACCSPWILNCRLWTEANRTDDIRGSPVTCCLRTE